MTDRISKHSFLLLSIAVLSLLYFPLSGNMYRLMENPYGTVQLSSTNSEFYAAGNMTVYTVKYDLFFYYVPREVYNNSTGTWAETEFPPRAVNRSVLFIIVDRNETWTIAPISSESVGKLPRELLAEAGRANLLVISYALSGLPAQTQIATASLDLTDYSPRFALSQWLTVVMLMLTIGSALFGTVWATIAWLLHKPNSSVHLAWTLTETDFANADRKELEAVEHTISNTSFSILFLGVELIWMWMYSRKLDSIALTMPSGSINFRLLSRIRKKVAMRSRTAGGIMILTLFFTIWIFLQQMPFWGFTVTSNESIQQAFRWPLDPSQPMSCLANNLVTTLITYISLCVILGFAGPISERGAFKLEKDIRKGATIMCAISLSMISINICLQTVVAIQSGPFFFWAFLERLVTLTIAGLVVLLVERRHK